MHSFFFPLIYNTKEFFMTKKNPSVGRSQTTDGPKRSLSHQDERNYKPVSTKEEHIPSIHKTKRYHSVIKYNVKSLNSLFFFSNSGKASCVSNKNTQKTNYEVFFSRKSFGRTIVSNEAFFGVWGWGHSNLHVLYKCMCMRWLKQIQLRKSAIQ